MKSVTRSWKFIAASGAMALCATSDGFGQQPFYVRGGVGPAFTQDTSLREFNGPISDTRVKFDTGVNFRIAGGYMFNEWLAGEIESGITYNEIRSITGASHVDANLLNAPFLVNLVFQCPPRNRFCPYVGGGIGVSSAVLDSHDIDIGGLHLSDTVGAAVFAYHGIAGCRYYFNEHMALSFEYEFFGTTAPDWESDVVFGTGTGHTRFGDNQTHAVMVGFTFRF